MEPNPCQVNNTTFQAKKSKDIKKQIHKNKFISPKMLAIWLYWIYNWVANLILTLQEVPVPQAQLLNSQLPHNQLHNSQPLNIQLQHNQLPNNLLQQQG